MQYYPVQLKAGIEYNLSVPGRYFLIDDIIGAASVDITLLDQSGSPRQIMPKRKIMFKCVTDFGGVLFNSAVDCTVAVFVSYDDVHNGYADGGNVTVPGGVVVTNLPAAAIPVTLHGSDDATPIPISFPGGVVNLTAANVGINNTSANPVPTLPNLAATVTNGAPVAVTAVAGVVVAADATRRGVRIKNVGANAVAIGGAGIVYANAAILIQPGETWNENEAPGAAWYAICDATLASTLNLQTIA